MNVGLILMIMAAIAMFAMPIVFAYAWAQIRINIKDEKMEKRAEKKVLTFLINGELFALMAFILSTYLRLMVSLHFVVVETLVIVAAIYYFNRMLKAQEVYCCRVKVTFCG